MRSIRLSLLAYFLSLLAVALGVFSFLTYENARDRLASTQTRTHQLLLEDTHRSQTLLEEQYKVTAQTLRADLDRTLLLKAQTMASQLAERVTTPERDFAAKVLRQVLPLTTAPLGPGPHTFYASVLDHEVRHNSWNSRRFFGPTQLDLTFADDVLFHSKAERSPFYFQVYHEQGDVMARSLSLGEESLRYDREAVAKLPPCQHHFDDIVQPSGKRLRLVTIRVPIVRLSVTRITPSGGNGRRGQPQGGPPMQSFRVSTELRAVNPKEMEGRGVIRVLLLYAKSSAELDEQLADLRSDLEKGQQQLQQDQERTFQELDEQSRLALASLRTKLLLISLGVFAATVVGGIWLVHRGLYPLQRLSSAVSQVSTKDFQLRIDADKMPTELQPIVQRLQRSLASLEMAFAREKQAAADISHDLRTPIASLLATTQVCLRKIRSPEEYRQTLESCRDIANQLNVLVERLLALARLDAGADKFRPELVDVSELAEQCATLVRPLAEEKGLRLNLERNGPIVLETDPNKLREILTNLLENAVQYNRPQGRINLAVERNNGHVQVEVRDTGIGIAPDVRQHLFERFFRADASRHAASSHSGLGLAIVKGYVDLMGGKIEVDSVPGEGSTFRVLLPANLEDFPEEPREGPKER